MRAAHKNALAGGAAQGAKAEREEALRSQYSTDDLFRIAYMRAHIIGIYKGRDRNRAIRHFLTALKAALARGDQ